MLTSVARGVLALPLEFRDVMAAAGESDGVVCYSARARAGDPERIQEFTAIGRFADAVPLRSANAWQRRIDWDHAAVPVGLRPVARSLDGAEDMYAWGRRLREGLVEMSRGDFEVLWRQMRPDPPDERRYR
ncbi:hypothetical protein D9V30_07220 [Mycetocola reblochoni]|uniref:Uncharacterized protein n=2 Tax=Mycetocola reblochoni TaxID=331618 RepID=A0A1R4ID75_9MICO|nr:hypothetical protein D9V30_07220 [Mycetocola reblochoni]SJN17758.1 hypothetical protein FM119_01140 [Mycetocola reblochoni REB411]